MHLDLMSRLRESLKICKPCRGKTWHQMAPGLSLGQWRAVETDFYAMTLTQDPAIGMTAGWAEGSPSPILGIWQSTYDTSDPPLLSEECTALGPAISLHAGPSGKEWFADYHGGSTWRKRTGRACQQEGASTALTAPRKEGFDDAAQHLGPNRVFNARSTPPQP